MFRRKVAIFLLLAFAALSFGNTLLLLDYQLNPRNYVKNCVNKYRPSLHCKGQCQLMKKIRAKEEKEKKETGSRAEINIVLFAPVQESTQHIIPLTRHRITEKNQAASCQPGFHSSIFQPPRC
ncbi:MAG TPA: hypothetical protein PLO99_13440 [Chitinophagaceae bacterium]|jgi:hypothetical protein|nr:hypothetical protein [Chitinophagaceae bacterium]HRG91680.1 hypothetical protein [Chitinophagaceae bacterium]